MTAFIRDSGLVPWKFSVNDVERMVEAGILAPKARVELIEGELIGMSPKGNRHEVLKTVLNRYFGKNAPDNAQFVPETTFRLSEHTYLEPDFLFYPADLRLKRVDGPKALLAVEVAHSSLGYDLGVKAKVYAGHGLRELWVIDAVKLETHVHTEPVADGYAQVRVAPSDEALSPQLIQGVSLRLRDLDLSGVED